jgi:hypothetical protein
MRTLYEVTANGSTVYNGDDETKANQTRTLWKGRGYTVEVTTVDVPDVIDAKAELPAERLTGPDAEMAGKLRVMSEFIREHSDELALLIPSACFALESVAHLRGMEKQLLPMTIRMRAILSGKAVKS